jgi:hypothetical protein
MSILNHLESKNRKEVAPSLFIGLGGSGRDILREIKRRLRAIYGGSLPGVYQFIYIDTAPLTNRLGQESIGQDEYVSLGECNPAEVAAHGELYPHITAWLPDPDPGITSARFGAGQRRYIGRMALFMRFPAVFEALSHKLADMKSIAAIEDLRLQGYQVNDTAPQVFVFGSLAGGTGSGVFLDIAYLIRELVPEAFLNGVFCLSDVFYPVLKNFNNRRRAEANCYAALSELDYFVHCRTFECDYGQRQITVQAAPFTTTYLIDIQNLRGKRLKRTEDVFRMVAHWAITQVAAGLGGQQREEMNNVAAAAQDMPSYLGHRRAYSSLVAAALLFPAEDIANYGGLRLGQTLIESGYLAPTNRTLNQVALIPALEPENLRRALQPDQAGLAIDRTHTRYIQRASKATAIFHALGRQTEDQAEGLDARRRSVQEQVPGLEVETVEAIETAVWEAVKHDGLEAGITFIRGSYQRVTEVIRALEAEQEETEGRHQDLEDRFRDARRQIEKLGRYAWLPWRRSRLREVGLYASRLLAERDETVLALSILRTAIDIYRRLQDGVDRQRPEFHNLRQLEGALQVRCKETGELSRQFEWTAQELLSGRATSPEVFDLVTPIVDGDYIRHFYEAHGGPVQDIAATFNEFNAGFAGLGDFLKTSVGELREQLFTFTRRPFEALVANIRVLDLFSEDPDLRGDIRLDALLARADVFLRYRGSQGFDELNDLAYTAHLGVDHWDPDEAAEYIEPALQKHHRAFSVTYTGDPHRVQVARTAHGFPLILLADLETFERSYEELSRSGASPLHTDKRWPLSRQNGRWPWAIETRPVSAPAKVKAL